MHMFLLTFEQIIGQVGRNMFLFLFIFLQGLYRDSGSDFNRACVKLTIKTLG